MLRLNPRRTLEENFMAAWDTDPFGNDTACDWAYSLDECEDLKMIVKTLERVEAVGDEYLDATEAEEAVAAADTLARLKGRAYVHNSHTEAVDEWVAQQHHSVSLELTELAIHVIDRILTEPSELLELWEESEDFDAWKKHLEDLKERLK